MKAKIKKYFKYLCDGCELMFLTSMCILTTILCVGTNITWQSITLGVIVFFLWVMFIGYISKKEGA